MTNGDPVTQKTIAKALNLDQSTVSLALCNHPRIPKETRDKIHALARSLGYKPSPILADLARQRWKGQKQAEVTIGYIVESRRARFGNTRWTWCGARKQAESLGYRLDHFFLEEYDSSANLQKVLCARGITDLIVNGIYQQVLPFELDWDRFVAVAAHQGIVRLGIHAVVNDHYGNIIRAWKKAVEFGYRRIGAILFEHHTNLIDDDLRMAGVLVCQQRLFPELSKIDPLIVNVLNAADYRLTHERVKVWMKKNQIDAVLGFHGGLYYFLSEEQKKSIAFINLHLPEMPKENPDTNERTPTYLQAGLVDVNEYAGIEAVNLLHMCRKTNQRGIPRRRIEHMVQPMWRDGFTLRPKTLEKG